MEFDSMRDIRSALKKKNKEEEILKNIENY
jgi:hypothetical protein